MSTVPPLNLVSALLSRQKHILPVFTIYTLLIDRFYLFKHFFFRVTVSRLVGLNALIFSNRSSSVFHSRLPFPLLLLPLQHRLPRGRPLALDNQIQGPLAQELPGSVGAGSRGRINQDQEIR